MLPQLNVLLIEDNDVDVEALRRHLSAFPGRLALTVVDDGATALTLLRGQSPQRPFPQPYLILLDLSLPQMDGFTFLGELRSDPALCNSIVFVLTESTDDVAKAAAYRCGIAGYFSKANLNAQFAHFLAVYSTIVEFPPL